MRTNVKKPIAVLLSALMLLTMVSIGFVAPAFAADTTALDAAIADANALTAANYVDFSGVTAAVNAAADTEGKTQTQIDDMEDAIRVAMTKLELKTKYTPQSYSSYMQYEEGNNVFINGTITMSGAITGQNLSNPSFRHNWAGAICWCTCQGLTDAVANYHLDRYYYNNLSQLGDIIALSYGSTGCIHRYNLYIDYCRAGDGSIGYQLSTGYDICGNSVTVTSAKGNSIAYSLTQGPGLLTANQYTDYTITTDFRNMLYWSGINGALPPAGDQVCFRVIANPMVTTLQSSNVWFIGGSYLYVNLTSFDTTNLRTSMAFNAAPKSSYTPESYAEYRTALDAASTLLNRGAPAQEDLDNATTTLNNAISNLQSVITIDGNGGTVSPETLTLTFGGNSSVAFPANNVTASRAGYDFAGWDKDTVTFNDTVKASWNVRYDTPFTVNHYYMSPDGTYGSPIQQTLMGETDTTVNAAGLVMETENYTLDADASDASVTILGDGSAALNLYYARNTNTVLFKNTAGETVQTDTLYYGATPDYTGTAPTLAGTDANTYTFLGWTANAAAEPGSDAAYYAANNLPPVTADVTYYPYFGAAVNSYEITFTVDGADTVVSFPYGATPAFNGIPTKAADEANTYTFSGWSPAIEAVTGEAAYVAQFAATPIQYLVRANSGKGSVIEDVTGLYNAGTALTFTVTVEEGYTDAAPVVTAGGETLMATGAAGNVYTYALTVNGNTDIRVADLAKNTYTVKFIVEGVETEKTVAYGDTPDFGSVPTKAADEENFYAFSGWSPAIVPATEDATYTAQFEATPIPAHEHDFATLVRTVAATCVSAGYDEYICDCGMTEQRNATAINAANHAKEPILVGARAATETEDGYTGDLICPACGETITAGHVEPKTAVPHAHDFATLVSHTDATCAAKAYDIYACECGETKKIETGEVNPDNHAAAPMTVGRRDASTEEYGYTGDVICPACDKVLSVGEVIEKLTVPHVHSFDTLIDSGEATCVAKAYTVYQCACGETERTETGDLNENNHAGNLITVGARAATATQGGYTGDTICTACGQTVETGTFTDPTDPGHTHSYDTEIESAPATCIAKAYTIYQCECDDTKKVETGEKDAANHVGEIKLMGYHAATETADGYSGDKYCLACGELVEAGHVLEHTGSTTPENPTQPDDPGNNGGSNTDTRIPFLEWLRNFIKKLLALFKIGSGEGSIC